MSTLQTQTADSTVHGKQCNHGDFHMPASIRHLGDMPLYRAVAWWGVFRGGEFGREDISRAFQIEPRRASGVLNYLCHRYDEDDITFEARRLPVRGGRHQLVVRILSVEAPAARPVPRAPVRKGPAGSGDQDRRMARWLLSRPAGNDAARLASWKAACPVPEDAC